MTTDGPIDELHAMAAKINLNRAWFQERANEAYSHYDLTPNKRFHALRLGAVEITDGQQFQAAMERKQAYLATSNDIDELPPLEPLEDETIRVEQIGRYRYSIEYKYATNSYYMRCSDTERPRNTMDHGPYSLEKCHEEIDRRVREAEEKKR